VDRRSKSGRIPKKWALLIIDMLNDFAAEGDCEYKRRFWRVAENIRQLAACCRQLSIPVVYVCDRHKGQDYDKTLKSTKTPPHAIEGTAGAAVVECLEPQEHDFVVPKTMYSAFFRTELERLLTNLGIDTVIVTGVHSHVCVLITATDAFSRELLVFVPRDCTTTIRDEAYNFALDFIERHVGTVVDSQYIREKIQNSEY
jgi:nicotinamidase-related amidase